MPGIRILTGTGLQFDDLGRTFPGEEKVFVQQRVIISYADHLLLQRALLKNEYLIVGEFDDDPAHFAELGRTDFLALRGCHCIQTSTDVMAESLRPHNPHVQVFPNQIASLPPIRTADQADSGPVTIFFGALNREADWSPILPTLNGILATHGARVGVQVVYDRLFFDSLTTDNKAFEPLCSYERYKALLSQAEIALLPLEPTPFNRHKSDLKFIESAAHGAAVLASPTVYAHTIRHGETGLIYSSLEEFAALLDRLIRDGPFRRSLAIAAHRHVKENRLLRAPRPIQTRLVPRDARPLGPTRRRASPASTRAEQAVIELALCEPMTARIDRTRKCRSWSTRDSCQNAYPAARRL